MKRIPVIIGIGLSSWLLGCASTPVVMAPVGPNPAALDTHTKTGQLEVFSALAGCSEGNNPTWFQHTDYTVYDRRGNQVEHVHNTVGYYATRPRLISLPPGHYVVEAEAKDYLSVEVPVVIAPGRLTKVHLDDAWRPAGVRKTELVSLPAGNPVGWAASAR